MIKRELLLDSLARHQPADDAESEGLKRIIHFVRAEPNCFERSNIAGHVTGSAMLISRDGNMVLLNHHKFLNIWIIFGGHADGEADIFNVAWRELVEESGIVSVAPVSKEIFDLDVHGIPDNPAKGEEPHYHYDICYLFQALGSDDFSVSHESHDIVWCDYNEAMRRCVSDKRMQRMLNKWKDRF